ncbi:MAG: hypothetical protein RL441_483 [Actinomycetota bacterium]
MSESVSEQSSVESSGSTAEAQAYVASILSLDARRLEAAVANLRQGMSEAEVHDYRVALTALHGNVDANASLLKKRPALRLQSLLSLLNRHASKARALDVKYQQALAWSLDADESTQAALSSTMALLDLKRQKARNEFALVLTSSEFQQILDEISQLVGRPVLKRKWAKRTAAEVEAEVWANRHKAIERFRTLLKVSRRKDSARKLHALRMSAKQVRYALDGLEGETDNRELARLTQACLGGLRDSQELVGWLQKRLEKRTTSKLERHAIAMLIDGEKLRAKRLERKFKDIRKSVS